jgi:hypothetical protein
LVGYSLGSHMTQKLVTQALFRAVAAKRPDRGLIPQASPHYSDA